MKFSPGRPVCTKASRPLQRLQKIHSLSGFLPALFWLALALPILLPVALLAEEKADQTGIPVEVHVEVRQEEVHQETETVRKSTATGERVPQVTTPLGMSAQLRELVLPGTLLTVKPLKNRHDPVVLRILESYPHGTAHRYSLEFYALEPGLYDLREQLQRADGSGIDDLPAIWVEASAALPAGQIAPLPLTETRLPRVGGYRLLLTIAGILWGLGLFALLFWRKRKQTETTKVYEQPVSLADRLRPLVEQARTGSLPAEKRAELERMLIAYWCNQLQLKEESPGKLMQVLREHPEAGPLLRSLEDWLHRPDPPERVDVEALLAPYSQVTEQQISGTAAPAKAATSSIPLARTAVGTGGHAG